MKTNKLCDMKQFVYLVIFCSIFSVHGQDNNKAEQPLIVPKLLLGNQYEYNSHIVKFVNVLNDSRCPKNVTCVRAGEAKVLVAIYKDAQFIEEKIIEITPTTYLTRNLPQLIISGETIIKGFNLTPYPEFGKEIKKANYILQIVVED